jgi:hypothetical protein
MRAVTGSLAIAVACSLLPLTAQAQSSSAGYPVVLESHIGLNDPLGPVGVALAYDRGRFTAGLGMGLFAQDNDGMRELGIFGRARLLRWGLKSLGVGLAFSRGYFSKRRDFNSYLSNEYHFSQMTWTWDPYYRATLSLFAETSSPRWGLRVAMGLGYLLNRPTCYYWGDYILFTGDCNSPEIPSQLHYSVAPDQLVVSLSLAGSFRFGVKDPDQPPSRLPLRAQPAPGGPIAPTAARAEEMDAASAYRSPSLALHLSLASTLVPILGGVVLLGAREREGGILGAGAMLLGISMGPSTGYAYAGKRLRGVGVGFLRLAGIGLGSLAAMYGILSTSCEYCGSSVGTDALTLLGVGLIITSVFSSIYDIATAPRVARQANAEHGFASPR